MCWAGLSLDWNKVERDTANFPTRDFFSNPHTHFHLSISLNHLCFTLSHNQSRQAGVSPLPWVCLRSYLGVPALVYLGGGPVADDIIAAWGSLQLQVRLVGFALQAPPVPVNLEGPSPQRASSRTSAVPSTSSHDAQGLDRPLYCP